MIQTNEFQSPMKVAARQNLEIETSEMDHLRFLIKNQ